MMKKAFASVTALLAVSAMMIPAAVGAVNTPTINESPANVIATPANTADVTVKKDIVLFNTDGSPILSPNITLISHRQLLRLLRLRLMRRMILKTASSRAMQRRLLLQSSRASSVLSRQEMMMTQLQIRSKARSRSVLRMIPRATIMQRNIMRTERMQQKLRSRTKSPTR